METASWRMRNYLGGLLSRIGEWIMPEPRPWPNNAVEVRDRAAEAAVEGIRTLEPVVAGERMDEVERLRREAKALNLFQRIARLLESVGARTKP